MGTIVDTSKSVACVSASLHDELEKVLDENRVLHTRAMMKEMSVRDNRHAYVWEIDEPEEDMLQQRVQGESRPAASIHLYWDPKTTRTSDLGSDWTLENSVTVRTVTDTTFYMTTGFAPGGYSGIQQRSENVREVPGTRGAGVQVKTFGGEGTGMKSMKV